MRLSRPRRVGIGKTPSRSLRLMVDSEHRNTQASSRSVSTSGRASRRARASFVTNETYRLPAARPSVSGASSLCCGVALASFPQRVAVRTDVQRPCPTSGFRGVGPALTLRLRGSHRPVRMALARRWISDQRQLVIRMGSPNLAPGGCRCLTVLLPKEARCRRSVRKRGRSWSQRRSSGISEHGGREGMDPGAGT